MTQLRSTAEGVAEPEAERQRLADIADFEAERAGESWDEGLDMIVRQVVGEERQADRVAVDVVPIGEEIEEFRAVDVGERRIHRIRGHLPAGKGIVEADRDLAE